MRRLVWLAVCVSWFACSGTEEAPDTEQEVSCDDACGAHRLCEVVGGSVECSADCEPGWSFDPSAGTCVEGTPCEFDTDCPAAAACQASSCEAGACVSGAVECPAASDACHEATCDPDSGCVEAPIVCEALDACHDVTCDPALGCVDTELPCEPSDACHAAACDPAAGCVRTEIVCEASDACHEATCDPDTGCIEAPIACEASDHCHEATCDRDTGCVEAPVECVASDACHTAVCDPTAGCVESPISCEPEDACTISVCNPAVGCEDVPRTCEASDACHDATCDPIVGCVETLVECPVFDACHEAACDPETGCGEHPRLCPTDANACTDASCDPELGCGHTPVVGRPCDDERLCTERDACDATGVCVGEPYVCADDNPCTADECNGDGTCAFGALDAVACTDDEVCTHSDACVAGECVGVAVVCEDENPCTDDTCVGGECPHAPLTGTTCSDGDLCTRDDVCDAAGACVGDIVACAAAEPCPTTVIFVGNLSDGRGSVGYTVLLPTPAPSPHAAHPFVPPDQGIYGRLTSRDTFDASDGSEHPFGTFGTPSVTVATAPHGLEPWGVDGDIHMSFSGLVLDAGAPADFYVDPVVPTLIHRIYRHGTMVFYEDVPGTGLVQIAEFEDFVGHLVVDYSVGAVTGTATGRLAPGSIALPSTYSFTSPEVVSCAGTIGGECYGHYDSVGEIVIDPCTEPDLCTEFSCDGGSGECLVSATVCDDLDPETIDVCLPDEGCTVEEPLP